MTLIYLVPDCKCVMVKFQEERNSLLSCLQDRFRIQNTGSFFSCLGIAVNGHQER